MNKHIADVYQPLLQQQIRDKHISVEIDEVCTLEFKTSNIATESNVAAETPRKKWPKSYQLAINSLTIAAA